jgi:ABC-type uncharacterized transport system permease subunit
MNASHHLIIIALLFAAVQSGTILLYPTIGEIFAERAGILNLGVEGMMIVGALIGFITTYITKNPYLGFIAGTIAGGLTALIHAFVSVTLRGNQVVSGLALTIFGLGFTNFYGQKWINLKLTAAPQPIAIPGLVRIPFIGPIFFKQDALVYISYIVAVVMWYILYKTKAGVHLRAVGQNARAADAMGVNVYATRYWWTFFGGLLAGAGGAYLTIGYSSFWLDGMTAGRGWIAIALVIFAMWDPLNAMLGAYLFGGIDALQLQLQAVGVTIPSSLLNMLPYLLTFIVIIIATLIVRVKHISAPKELGSPYNREEK